MTNQPGGAECFDCGEDTSKAREYYMLRNDRWSACGVVGVLCVGCCETRLGKLTREDFDPGYLKLVDSGLVVSERLKDRLGPPRHKKT
jgi:hypothetical protein